MSLESRNGWNDLYISLGSWPERIIAAINAGNRERDERDFYLCFFVQSHAMIDWLIETGLMKKQEIFGFVYSYDCMKLCIDISNRYKYLTLTRTVKFDAGWEIWIDYERTDSAYSVTANGRTWLLWDLMIECICFWEACTAAFDLSSKSRVFRPS